MAKLIGALAAKSATTKPASKTNQDAASRQEHYNVEAHCGRHRVHAFFERPLLCSNDGLS